MESFLGVSVKITLKPDSEFSAAIGTIQNLEPDSQKLELADVVIFSKSDRLLRASKYDIYGDMVEEIEILSAEALRDAISAHENMPLEQNQNQNQNEPTSQVSGTQAQTQYLDLSDIRNALPNSHALDPAIVSIMSSSTKQPSSPQTLPLSEQLDPIFQDSAARFNRNITTTPTPSSAFKQSKITQPQSASNVNRSMKSSAIKAKNNLDSWAHQDVTNYNELEFDFEANLKLFDKKKVFEEIRSKDDTDPAMLLVNTNKLVKAAPAVDLSQLNGLLSSNKKPSRLSTSFNDLLSASNRSDNDVDSQSDSRQFMGNGLNRRNKVNANLIAVSPNQWFKMESLLKRKAGVDESGLLEVAGRVASLVSVNILQSSNKLTVRRNSTKGNNKPRILVVAGKGRNGLFGLCCARYLVNMGADVHVFTLFDESEPEFAAYQKLQLLKITGAQVITTTMHLKKMKFEMVIDALFTPNDVAAYGDPASGDTVTIEDIIEHTDYKNLLKPLSRWLHKQKRTIKLFFEFPTLVAVSVTASKSKLDHNGNRVNQTGNYPQSNKGPSKNFARYPGPASGSTDPETTDGYNSDVDEDHVDDTPSSNMHILFFGMPSDLLSKSTRSPLSQLVDSACYNLMLADIGIPFPVWQQVQKDENSTKFSKSPFLFADVIDIEF